MNKTKTEIYQNIFTYDESMAIFHYLKDNILWEDGSPSKINGFTRKAKSMLIHEDDIIYNTVQKAINICNHPKINSIHQIEGIYLNYQRNGHDYTPAHSHKNSIQLIINFGATRNFNVGTKNVCLEIR
jgi:hypothetical protein